VIKKAKGFVYLRQTFCIVSEAKFVHKLNSCSKIMTLVQNEMLQIEKPVRHFKMFVETFCTGKNRKLQ
jgi:hypothetical protein